VLRTAPEFKEIPCTDKKPLVFKRLLEIEGRNFTGEASTTIKGAEEYVCRLVANAAFHLKYPDPAKPPHPCQDSDEFEEFGDTLY